MWMRWYDYRNWAKTLNWWSSEAKYQWSEGHFRPAGRPNLVSRINPCRQDPRLIMNMHVKDLGHGNFHVLVVSHALPFSSLNPSTIHRRSRVIPRRPNNKIRKVIVAPQALAIAHCHFGGTYFCIWMPWEPRNLFLMLCCSCFGKDLNSSSAIFSLKKLK